jgi:hypothetical protein
MEALHAVPMVRQDPSREERPLIDLVGQAASGRLQGRRLIQAVRQLRNRRHESKEGKFEIDRAIDAATAALEQDRRQPTPSPSAPPPSPPSVAPGHNLGDTTDIAARLAPDSLAASTSTPLGGGTVGAVERLEWPDGTRLVRKRNNDWREASARDVTDAEELAALVGQALGARVPRQRRIDVDTVVGDFATGTPAAEAEITNPKRVSQALATKGARRLGLLDLVTLNGDRHSGNWTIDADGQPTGIDHGATWAVGSRALSGALASPSLRPTDMADIVSGGAAHQTMTRPFLNESRDGLAAEVPMTRDDVDNARQRLEALRQQFEAMGREAWLALSLRMLDALRERARDGGESIFDD